MAPHKQPFFFSFIVLSFCSATFWNGDRILSTWGDEEENKLSYKRMKKNIYNFQKREELSYLADQDIQRKCGVWESLRDKHVKLLCDTFGTWGNKGVFGGIF